MPVEYADEAVESVLLGMLGKSERQERVWDSGSDNSAELASVNDELVDLTSQLGKGIFRVGTPQRAQLDQRIAALDARQRELSAEAVKPAGWTWQPTGEKFGDWWARQDITGRNIWLRSMNVRMDFWRSTGIDGKVVSRVNLDIGDLETLAKQLDASGPVAEWQKVFDYVRDNGIQGVTVGTDGSIAITPKGLTDEEEAAASEFYGWEV